jgi:mannitol-1-phosphate/altronate dehydrogenase
MDKEVNGHLYIANDNLKRIADALEEVIRLVKQDQEKFERYKEETTERWDEPKVRENPESIQTK